MVKETQNERAEKPESPGGSSGRNSRVKPLGAPNATAAEEATGPGTTKLMEAVVERSNMLQALHQVESSMGAAGADGMDLRVCHVI